MEITKRQLRQIAITAYTHGLNEMWRDNFYKWLDEKVNKQLNKRKL